MKHLLKYDSPVHNLQVFLRTISREYPEIPDVIPDGVYGNATNDAVIAFGNRFNIRNDGITDFSVWEHIIRVYKEIEESNSLNCVRIYPESGINKEDASYMASIIIIQSMILSLSEIFSNIPAVTVNGIEDSQTVEAIKSIQVVFGQKPDGVVTPIFWNNLAALYEAYISANRVYNSSQNITTYL